ncbi:hypothetical protein BUALT_Bualt01G0042500 [Buddleja alternifolia]|uniref:Uncharacterized protein n=1 Tax=Buddleja alternifolia TaxID=168488 RepID=A0AAV6YB07_9LAMI|nr:hypothetical protein BUALT_Bualt01G0042500 [Buddleja alternifolia]
MEKAKQVGSSSSSFTTDLFGPKDSSKSSSTVFGSIFGPPTTVPGKDTSREDFGRASNAKHEYTDYASQKGVNVMKKDKNNPNNYENGSRVEPSCYFNSSIYYGGQEVYSPTTRNISPPHNFKKDGEVDPNEDNSNCASRGNWWQGEESTI